MAKTKAHELREKTRKDLTKQLEDLKEEVRIFFYHVALAFRAKRCLAAALLRNFAFWRLVAA
jgi:hypothetical protein